MTYELPPIGHALSGGVAAALSNVVIYPLDLATTRVQSQSTSKSASSSATGGRHSRGEDEDDKTPKPIEFKRVADASEFPRIAVVPKKVHYKNELDAIRKIYSTEGFRALYSGLGSDTIATLTSNFVYFYVYTWLRQYKERHRRSGQLSVVQELFLGAEAGIISRLFTNPIHVVTTRQQVAGKESTTRIAGEKNIVGLSSSVRSIIRDIFQQHGLLGFWAGYAPTVILSINPSITYFLFETLKKTIINRQTEKLLKQHRSAGTEATKAALAAAATLSSLQVFFISAFSKAMASLITYPLILSKTKLQAKKESDDEDEGEKGVTAASTTSSSATLTTTTTTTTTTTVITSNSSETTTTTTSSKATRCSTNKESFDGISDVFRTVIRDQGIRGLYVGCQGQVIKGFFSFGLMYMIKDRVVAWMLALFLTMHNMRKRVAN
ncbi:hypothetical protein BGW41_003651 [Actinomortierella wolfii]|nr:hypothetical protein BGW41_003651 [Actinomortierella wolfii]